MGGRAAEEHCCLTRRIATANDDRFRVLAVSRLVLGRRIIDTGAFEFADAVLGKGKTSTSFDFSGPLTESVLLGPLATHFPNTTLQWNGGRAKFSNLPEANRFLRAKYRAGWSVPGLG